VDGSHVYRVDLSVIRKVCHAGDYPALVEPIRPKQAAPVICHQGNSSSPKLAPICIGAILDGRSTVPCLV
jgi:hypothetical protein